MNEKHLHDSIKPFLPELVGLRHLNSIYKHENLSRMHLELLYVLASKRHLDLFEIASLLNIGHMSAADMVDALIEKGLVKADKVNENLKFSVREKSSLKRNSGFTPIKNVIKHHKSPENEYAMLSSRRLKEGRN